LPDTSSPTWKPGEASTATAEPWDASFRNAPDFGYYWEKPSPPESHGAPGLRRLFCRRARHPPLVLKLGCPTRVLTDGVGSAVWGPASPRVPAVRSSGAIMPQTRPFLAANPRQLTPTRFRLVARPTLAQCFSVCVRV
jgi:hypothetical protein